MCKRTFSTGAAAAVLLGSMTGCMELDVANENNPGTEQALSNAADVEAVIVSTFLEWFGTYTGLTEASMVYPVLADEATNTRATIRSFQWSQEPRLPLGNDPLDDTVWIPRLLWDRNASCTANANDGLRRINNDGLEILTADPGETVADHTDRAVVFAKLMQGLCHGYSALSLDRWAVATEDTIIPPGYDDGLAWEIARLSGGSMYMEGLEVAIGSLEAAIERAETGDPWLTPETWLNQQQYDNQQIIELAHTLIARLLVYVARTPEDREAVDWQQVLFHTERGITSYDGWGPTLETGVVTANNWLTSLIRIDGNANRLRADPHLLGPADNSGNYQAWLSLPRDQRDRFMITTPDRRITGDTPDSAGAYFRFTDDLSQLDPSRGTYNFSFYSWWRRLNEIGCDGSCGQYMLATRDENRLLRAEALLRTGDLQGAADLINVTRTRGVTIGNVEIPENLPPVTMNGVPEVDGQCVPRRKTGECGDLLDALKWERQIELMGLDALRAWSDYRGFGQLQEGTFLHMPAPGRYLVSMGLPIYTFGGVGGDGAAP